MDLCKRTDSNTAASIPRDRDFDSLPLDVLLAPSRRPADSCPRPFPLPAFRRTWIGHGQERTRGDAGCASSLTSFSSRG